MMLKILVLCLGFFTVAMIPSVSAYAQQAAEAQSQSLAPKISDEDMKERIRYAEEFHDIRPMRDAVNRNLEEYAKGLPEADREEFLRFVQLHIDYDKLEELSIQKMAEVYTVPEMKAMIAYFGSADGKSAEAKGPAYTSQIGPHITKAIDSALMDTRYGPSSGQ